MDIILSGELIDFLFYGKKVGSFARPFFMVGDTLEEFMSDIDSVDFEWYFHCDVLLKTGCNEYCFRSHGNSFYFDKRVAIKLGGFIGTL